jgi:type I restriction enzyme S subunit
MAVLKPYLEYRDSGVPWLGEVPKHWKVQKLRTIMKGVTERNRPDLPLLSVVREKGVILRDITEKGENHNFIPDDLSNYKVVREGQFVMNKMKAWQGSYGVSRYNGIVSPAYFVFDIHLVEGSYFHSAIRSKAYVPLFTQASDGVRIGQWDLSQVRMKEIPFFIPSLAEQSAIVRFLDHMDRRIRRNILAKQKLIKLLEEYKQVIIHRAVTRGLDPTVPLKPSGVEWLGEIPEDWAFLRGKFYFQEIDKRSATGKEELLSVSHITGVTPRSQKNINMFKAESYIGYKLCNPGQIVVNTMWAWMAAIGVSRYHGIVSSSYHTYDQINKHNFHNDFLDLLLRSTLYKINYAMNSTGITSSRLRLYPEDFLNIRFLCPPMGEQEAIICWLKCMIGDLDIAKERLNGEIALLKEYRTRLISDVVTGKLDVRGIELPADEDAEVPTELSELLDDDITPDDCEIPEDEIPAEAD